MLEDRKPTEQELNEKRDYIMIDTCHERYSFETHIRIYPNTSLQEIIDDNWRH